VSDFVLFFRWVVEVERKSAKWKKVRSSSSTTERKGERERERLGVGHSDLSLSFIVSGGGGGSGRENRGAKGKRGGVEASESMLPLKKSSLLLLQPKKRIKTKETTLIR
jgi:hypothetical protein